MNISNTNITGLILAAGASTRMGTHKALLEFDDGTTLLANQAQLLSNSGCSSVGVVIGAKHEEVKGRHVELDAWWIINKNWQLGQFSSIQTGLREAIKDDPNGIVLLPVDVVSVRPSTIKEIIATSLRNPHINAIVPEYDGRGGHPIYISKILCEEIVQLDPTDENSRLDFQLQRERSLIRLPVNDPGILGSVNTPEEWKKRRST